jgi:hypothetical protein
MRRHLHHGRDSRNGAAWLARRLDPIIVGLVPKWIGIKTADFNSVNALGGVLPV